MNGYVLLFIAVIVEIIATTALKATNGFKVLFPSIIVILGYGIAFYLLGQVVKTLPVGIVYAIWSGLGIVGTTVLAFFLYGQRLDFPALLGIVCIIIGVLIIQFLSKSVSGS